MHTTIGQEYLAPCCRIAREAGNLIMTYFSGVYDTRRKDDKSPVTDADVAANRHIVEALSQLTPSIPIVAEEDESLAHHEHTRFWLVDPLDGTRSFVRGEPEFTVNIALVENNAPVIGIIYAPPQQLMYWGGPGLGAWKSEGEGKAETIAAIAPSGGLVVTRSKSHPSKETAAYLETLDIREVLSSSSSIKFCTIAEGRADIYPRFGRTMEWDTAAGHAILLAAGGRVETIDGKPLTYGKPGFENPHFIAYGK